MSEQKRPGLYVDILPSALSLPIALPKLPSLPGLPALPTIKFPELALPTIKFPELPTFSIGLLDAPGPEVDAALEDMRVMLAGKVRTAVRMRDALEAEQQQRDAAELPAILAEAKRVFGGK